MSRTYAQHQQDLLPGFLRDDAGFAWARAQGTLKDQLVVRTRQSVYAGGAADPEGRGRECPADGLPRLALDADLDRSPGESDTSLRARIAGVWESWSWAGTRYGIAYAVGLAGYGWPAVWAAREWFVDVGARWARVVAVFRGLPAWDCGCVWDGDDTWDSTRLAALEPIETADADVARAVLRPVLRKWMNARDVCDRVVLAYGSLLWDLDGVWDGEDVWDEGDGEDIWQSPEWDTSEAGAVWDAPHLAWDAFC